MGRKSSKTAHVLNLLTAGANEDAVTEGEQTEEGLSVAKMLQKQPSRKKAPAAKAPHEPSEPKPKNDTPLAAEPVISRDESPASAKPSGFAEEVSQPEPEAIHAASVDTPPAPAASDASAQPVQSAVPVAVQPPVEEVPASNPAPSAAGKEPEKELHSLINIAEYAITSKIDEIIERMNVCRCNLCRQDIAAAALNLMPVQYVSTEELHGDALEQYLAENGKDVTAALVKACIKVKTKPRH